MSSKLTFCWVLWIGGTLLILASWFHAVPTAIGWIGFGIAMLGTLISYESQSLQNTSRSETEDGKSP